MPPLVRPDERRASPAAAWPGQPGAGPTPAANPPSPNASRGARPRAPSSTATTTAAVPTHAGQNSRCDSSSPDALRHGSTGATAMRNRRVSPIGMVMRSK